ncbi:MAG: hypothetical protein WDM84_03230 [Bauldia sp.]
MSTSATAAIIDLDDYRNRRKAKAQAEGGAALPTPMGWCLVWFAPVFLVQPYALAANR